MNLPTREEAKQIVEANKVAHYCLPGNIVTILEAYSSGSLIEARTEGEIIDFLDSWGYRQGNLLKCNDDDFRKIAHALVGKV
jgi:hypothetical protein